MKIKESYTKPRFAEHGETDKKNSWYWSVLLKNMRTWKKAEEAIKFSRHRVDPTYQLEKLKFKP